MKTWLENHWVVPAYSGAVMIGITICFFAAATNTMAGWLYAICGTTIALLLLSAILPPRSLRSLSVRRLPIAPVSAGDDISVTLEIINPSQDAKTLLEVHDILPSVLDRPHSTSIEVIPPQSTHRWTHYILTSKRGIYHWHDVNLRSAAPLGLFWCHRSRQTPAKAVVYPQILPLQQCPIIDSLGQENNPLLHSDRHYQQANEGFTRNLRQYRYGDPTRLIHWKTSARLGDFQVRELEILSGGQEVILCLDTQSHWTEATFDRAITAAASLYIYASRRQFPVKLWTAGTGSIHGERLILETLAAVASGETENLHPLPRLPLIWLTEQIATTETLPAGSRWIWFPDPESGASSAQLPNRLTGLAIEPQRSLQQQLQTPPR